MIGGALIGKGNFRKFDDYDLTIKVKDFSVNKESEFYDLIFTSRLLDIFSILQNRIRVSTLFYYERKED